MKMLINKYSNELKTLTHSGHGGDAGGGGDLTEARGEALDLLQARPGHGDVRGLREDNVRGSLLAKRILQFFRLVFLMRSFNH